MRLAELVHCFFVCQYWRTLAHGAGWALSVNVLPPHMQATGLPSITVQPALQVPFENRNNRATVAIFKFESGAVGSLSHTLLLHGSDFFSELDVFADGFHAIVTDPYQNPGLRVRLPGQDKYQQVSCQGHICCRLSDTVLLAVLPAVVQPSW